jgi:hypothetical protein
MRVVMWRREFHVKAQTMKVADKRESPQMIEGLMDTK